MDWQSNKIARMRNTNLLAQETEQCTVLTFSEPMWAENVTEEEAETEIVSVKAAKTEEVVKR